MTEQVQQYITKQVKYAVCPIANCQVLPNFLERHKLRAHPEVYGRPEFHNSVQSYSEHFQALVHSQQNKVLKFLEARCIEYEGGGVYICKPLPGYNKTTYRLKREADSFECTCQFYQTHKEDGEPRYCSHMGALYEFFRNGQRYEEVVA